MSYNISQRSVIEFINDSEIKLPRFQRKSTWKPGQGFELIISMAKEYPMGVVVINREQGISWLLDGRQRLSALKDFRNDPNRMYEAAKSYLKFNDTTTDDELKEIFWKRVETYLISMSPDTPNNECEPVEFEFQDNTPDEDEYESGIDRERQQEGLKTLLDVIRMAHQRRKIDRMSSRKYGSWERLFKLDEYLTNLPYQLKKEGFEINSVQLRKYLLEVGTEANEKRIHLSPEHFIDKVDEMIKEGKEQKFRDYVSHHWTEMANVIEVIVRSEKIFRNATIGVIMIQNVTPLDILKKEEGGRHTPFHNHYRPQFYIRTLDVTGEITLPEGVEMVMPGDHVEIIVDLINPVACDQGLRFAIREGGHTVGSGQITEILD